MTLYLFRVDHVVQSRVRGDLLLADDAPLVPVLIIARQNPQGFRCVSGPFTGFRQSGHAGGEPAGILKGSGERLVRNYLYVADNSLRKTSSCSFRASRVSLSPGRRPA